MRLMSWPDGEHYLRPLQFVVVSLLSSVVSTLLFSRTGGVLSDQNYLTHRFPRLLSRQKQTNFFVGLLSAAQHLTPAVVCDSSFLHVFVYFYCMCLKSHTFIFLFY